MTAFGFLLEWAARSSVLIAAGAVAIVLLRLRNPSTRLAVWIAILCGSAGMPVLMTGPKISIEWRSAPPVGAATPGTAFSGVAETPVAALPSQASKPHSFDWKSAALALYAAGTLVLLARVAIGVLLSFRLLRGSRAADRTQDGIEIRESNRITAPVTLGIIRPVIVLPSDWRAWNEAKLAAVISHESSHILRFDPAAQLLSAVHRALLWHSPLSWFLHGAIVRTAEEASDDAAVLAIGNRTAYAEMLMDFLRGRTEQPGAVCMARYGSAEDRIDRILNAPGASRKLTRAGVAAVLALAAPLSYLAAAVEPQEGQRRPSTLSSDQHAAVHAEPAVQAAAASRRGQKKTGPKPDATPGYLTGLGTVTPFQTVTIRARFDGELTEVSFKEGEPVEKGQMMAKLGAPGLEMELNRALQRIAQDRKELAQSGANPAPEALAEKERGIRQEMLEVERLNQQVSLLQIRSPISGIAGLRMVDVGNTVHVSDPIVVVMQIEPIAVLFTVPEDYVPVLRARLAGGGEAPVEAWNRDNSVKLATGRLIAMDNAIDTQTGTLKVKAEFENHGGALFPNQFVIVRIPLEEK